MLRYYEKNKRRSRKIRYIVCGIMMFALISTGCTKGFDRSTSIKKIKDIAIPDKDITAYKESGGIVSAVKKNSASCTFQDIKVTVTCPDGWRASTSEYEASYELSNIWATNGAVPKLELDMGISEVENKSYKYLKDTLTKKVKSMNSWDRDDYYVHHKKEFLKMMEKEYEYALKKGEYHKWSELTFDTATFDDQEYLVAKGALKPVNETRSQKGSCWYITIRKGKLFQFMFKTQNASIDEPTQSIFDGIMKDVEYEEV